MQLNEIQSEYDRLWQSGWGTVDVNELAFLQSLIETHKPARFVEVGMASGMSTGFIARFLEENGGTALTSIDHDDTFFGDTSKPNGFLIPELYKGSGVALNLCKFKTALDIDTLGGPWDMAFIDANHQHPWPTLDTLALAPHITGSKIVIHHDLDLYMKQDVMFGIGPKYIHDQFPADKRHVSSANNGNIFYISLDMPREELEEIAIKSLKLPWSLRTPLQDHYITQIRTMLDTHYSPRLRAHFDRCVANQNVADRFRSGL